MTDIPQLIDEYAAGPQKLRQAIAGMTPEQIDAAPVPGKWSTRQVICHVADFEPIYADRMKRAIAENEPTIFGGDPEAFAARLAYEQRDIDEELLMMESIRKHVARILRTLPPDAFQRKVNHSEDGRITLQTLLERITNHIPHHVQFIEEKKRAMEAGG
ncbi:MAG: DinB family protein [Planctomycetia bacterium]|nr:DinB family protein [Planctomycetia bacterium]